MPDHRWLVLRLSAPMVSFGGVAIDQVGVTRDFPAQSMITGLIANALGLHRTEHEAHQALQDRLIFGARWDEAPDPTSRLTDTQNAQLDRNDRGWTTQGTPEGRTGASYGAPHRRRRDYLADVELTVVLRLTEAAEGPDLDAISAALVRPARPLYIGRKPCLPSAPVCTGDMLLAPDAYSALQRVPAGVTGIGLLRALWPEGDGPISDDTSVTRVIDLPDQRNWRTGLHGGTRRVVEGWVMPEASGATA